MSITDRSRTGRAIVNAVGKFPGASRRVDAFLAVFGLGLLFRRAVIEVTRPDEDWRRYRAGSRMVGLHRRQHARRPA